MLVYIIMVYNNKRNVPILVYQDQTLAKDAVKRLEKDRILAALEARFAIITMEVST